MRPETRRTSSESSARVAPTVTTSAVGAPAVAGEQREQGLALGALRPVETVRPAPVAVPQRAPEAREHLVVVGIAPVDLDREQVGRSRPWRARGRCRRPGARPPRGRAPRRRDWRARRRCRRCSAGRQTSRARGAPPPRRRRRSGLRRAVPPIVVLPCRTALAAPSVSSHRPLAMNVRERWALATQMIAAAIASRMAGKRRWLVTPDQLIGSRPLADRDAARERGQPRCERRPRGAPRA